MNISTTLLVVLMFTSIVGIGIANILMAFAGHVSSMTSFAGRRIGTAWLIILLLTFLGMFWNSTVLVQREDWDYSLFLLVIIGPVLLLFAGSLMSRLLGSEEDTDNSTHVNLALVRFFLIYALVHAWFIGMDFVLGNGWTTATSMSAILLLIAVALAIVRNTKLVWGFTLSMLTLSLVDIFVA